MADTKESDCGMDTMQVFTGLQIALDLGISLNFKKKSELRKAIVDNGGTISYIVTKKCHIVITSDPEKCDMSSKCRMALKYGLPVLKLDYIWDCMSAEKLQPYDAYVVGGKATSLDFKSGKISAGKAGSQAKGKKKRIVAQFNPNSIHVWREGDTAQPEYDETRHEVAKYTMFTCFNATTNCEESYVVELHAPSQAKVQDSNKQEYADNKSQCFPYRIFFQSGSMSSLKAGQNLRVESRYTVTADQAQDVYAMLVNSVARKPGAQVSRSPMRGLGSALLQRKLSEVVGVHEGCSEEVKDLVEHIWREAMSEVTSILGKLSAIKLDQVEKADAVLSKISSALQSFHSDKDIEQLVREFYSTLNVKEKKVQSELEMKLPWKKWLVKKRDLCQLVKDIVSVSETTNFENQAVVEAKYAALRCRITALSGPSRAEIEQLVLSNIEDGSELKVLNVYEVWRQVEDVDFRCDLEPQQLLFHSSRVENFVGILSRGLLLPKVVVDEFGGTRSDAGMLGSGIYFASASSTSVKYSAPSSTKGTRLMLINEVALGTTKDYLQHDTTLTAPPEGFHSTHGVATTDNKDSQFEVHEYVVYKTNQQRIRYLVEFATVEDQPQSLESSPQDDTYIFSLSSDTHNDISLHDVMDVADPMDKLKPGLVGSGDQEVELKGVHIRAKLIDMAGEVVVLQEYYNNSSEPIEAKYVFPLGEGAAVCGFEAFINGKHVVGEVKEKETAHKEYKKAISEGHGAYLMDQDEETPDVFTVSVGNLPAGACVLIKITYVTELRVEDEKISFRLPGTVAPWKEKTALQQTTQTELSSHKTKAMKTTVQVAVEMPFDIRTLQCPTHSVKVKQTASKAFVELARHQEFGSGFLLLIGLAEIHLPRMWVEKHPSKLHHQACMLTFYPEFELEEVTEGEIIILLDMSNSMKGTQILKLALLVLQNIPQGFKFNVVRFGSDHEELFPASKLKTNETAEQARIFVETSSTSLGSTDLRSALRPFYLLPPGDASGPDLQRNVFLLSDGHLVEESHVLDEAARHSWHTRVFTFGVSPTCNSHTLRALARVSAGAFEYFDPKTKSKWQPKVKSQIAKARQPGLTSVCVEWQQFDDNLPPPVQAPRQITALFNGSQQIIFGFVPNCTMATLKAVIGGHEVSTVVSTSELSSTEGMLVHRLTARAIIQDWEAGVLDRDRTHHELSKMDLKDYVIELSKEYSLVTQLTSFVAVEKREENEKESLAVGPTMQELLDKEGVENLAYMGWTSLPEVSLESLVEDLSFQEEETGDSHQEKTEKTAMLEKLYRAQCDKTGLCTLETLQTAMVLTDSYRYLGETEKADNITMQTLRDASAALPELVEVDNYSVMTTCLAHLRRKLPQNLKLSEGGQMFIPWPKQGNVTIKVRTMTGDIQEFSVSPDLNVKQLKDMIYTREGLPQETQRLIYGCKQLDDTRVLSDLGPDIDAVFYLVQRLRGGGDGPPRGLLLSGQSQKADDIGEIYGVADAADVSLESESDFSSSEGETLDDQDWDSLKKSSPMMEEEDDEEMGFGLFDDGVNENLYSNVSNLSGGMCLESISDYALPQSDLLEEHSSEETHLAVDEAVCFADSVDLETETWLDLSVNYELLERLGSDVVEMKKKKKKQTGNSFMSDPVDDLLDDITSGYKKSLPSGSSRGPLTHQVFGSADLRKARARREESPETLLGASLFGSHKIKEKAEQSLIGAAVPVGPRPGFSAFSTPASQPMFQLQCLGGLAPQQMSPVFGGSASQPLSSAFGGSAPQPMSAAFGGSAPQPMSAVSGRSAPQQMSAVSGGSAPQQMSAVSGRSAPQPMSSAFGGSALQPMSAVSGRSAPQQMSAVSGRSAPQPMSAVSGRSAPQPMSLAFGGSAPQPMSAVSGRSAPQPMSAVSGRSAPQPMSAVTGRSAPQQMSAVSGGSAPQPMSAVSGGSAPQPMSAVSGRSAPQPMSAVSGGSAPQPMSAVSGRSAPQPMSAVTGGSAPQQMSAVSGGSAPQPMSSAFGGSAPQPTFGFAAVSQSAQQPIFESAAFGGSMSTFLQSAPPPPPAPAPPPPPSAPHKKNSRPVAAPPPPAAAQKALPRSLQPQVLSIPDTGYLAAKPGRKPPLPPPEEETVEDFFGIPPPPPPQSLTCSADKDIDDTVLTVCMAKLGRSSRGYSPSSPAHSPSSPAYSPSSPAYSPSSPAYSPSSAAFSPAPTSGKRSSLVVNSAPAGRGGKVTVRRMRLSEEQQQQDSQQLKGVEEKRQISNSKKCHGSVSWRSVGVTNTSMRAERLLDLQSRQLSAPSSPARSREKSRERGEDVASFLSLASSEFHPGDFADLYQEQEAPKVLAKYNMMKKSGLKGMKPARKRTCEIASSASHSAVPSKKFWHEAPFGIGTDLSPARVRHSVKLSGQNVTKLLLLQSRDGSWLFGQEFDDLLGVSGTQCIGVLITSGLSSLGMKARDEIQRLLATLLALFALLEKLLPQFSTSEQPAWADVVDYLRLLSRREAWNLLKERFEGSSEQDVATSIIEALEFLTRVDQKYPALYSRLELGTNWFNVAINLMGPPIVAAA